MLAHLDPFKEQLEKDEAFKYVPLKKLYRETFSKPKSSKISLSNAPEGIISCSIKEAAQTYGAFLQKKEKEKAADPFTSINKVASQEGLFLYIPPKIALKEPLIIHIESAANPQIIVFMGKEASATLAVKTSAEEPFFSNQLIDVTLEENASLRIEYTQKISFEGYFFNNLTANLKRNAQLSALSITEGAKIIRQHAHIKLNGEGSNVELKGLARLEKSAEAHTHILIEHLAPHTTSSQHFKNVLFDQARSSFEGKVFVQDIAQKTEAYQLNNNLLLGEKTHAFSKPNLEIFADDVKASHGATIGQLDAEELFYLRTRGLSYKEAYHLLIQGFCKEITDQVTVHDL